MSITDFATTPSPSDAALCSTHVVVVCFDATRRSTYDNASTWVASAKPALSRGAALFILGLKADAEMFAGAREFARTMASLHSAAGTAFASAKSGSGVEDAFRSIAEAARNSEAAALPAEGGKGKCIVS